MSSLHLAGKVATMCIAGVRHVRGAERKLPQIIQRADEELVLRGSGNGAVQCNILDCPVAAYSRGAVKRLFCAMDAFVIFVAAPSCCKGGYPGFKSPPHVDRLNHRTL